MRPSHYVIRFEFVSSIRIQHSTKSCQKYSYPLRPLKKNISKILDSQVLKNKKTFPSIIDIEKDIS